MTAQASIVWKMFNRLDLEGKNQLLTRLVDAFHTSTASVISPELKAHIESRHLASVASSVVHYDWADAKMKVKEALAKRRR
ncbi:MAG: hypothetical protein AAGG68_30935 [Bacteroidota bacterium]